MPNLTWFQYDVAWWQERIESFGLDFESEGILMRLVRAAWDAPVPCTIRDHEDEFAKILGAKWRRGVALIREHFKPDEENKGRLRCDWLSGVYALALSKHESYQNRGKLGGRPKKKAAPESSDKAQVSKSSQNPKAQLLQNKTEGNSSGPTGHRAIPPASGDALGDEPPRAPAASLPDPRLVEELYTQWAYDRVDAWRETHRDEWDSITADERRSVGLGARHLSPQRHGTLPERTFYANVAGRVSVVLDLPAPDAWAESDEGKSVLNAAAHAAGGVAA